MKDVVLLQNFTDRKGRVYSKDELLEQAVGKSFFGELASKNTPIWVKEVDISRVSHTVSNIRIEGNNLVGDVAFIASPMGNVAKSLMENDVTLTTSIRATGVVNEVGGKLNVTGLKLLTFDIMAEKEQS
jgi:hypothetical protein